MAAPNRSSSGPYVKSEGVTSSFCTNQDRIKGACVAVFDAQRVVMWLSDPLVGHYPHVDFPLLDGMRPHVIHIVCQNGSDFLQDLQLITIEGGKHGFEISYSQSMVELGAGTLFGNASTATIRLHTYYGIAPLLRTIRVVGSKSLAGADIRLSRATPTKEMPYLLTQIWKCSKLPPRPDKTYVFDMFRFKPLV